MSSCVSLTGASREDSWQPLAMTCTMTLPGSHRGRCHPHHMPECMVPAIALDKIPERLRWLDSWRLGPTGTCGTFWINLIITKIYIHTPVGF